MACDIQISLRDMVGRFGNRAFPAEVRNMLEQPGAEQFKAATEKLIEFELRLSGCDGEDLEKSDFDTKVSSPFCPSI